MKLGFGKYVWGAFNARPIGMFVPPNWVGLAAVAALGLINPGFWIIGAGVELAYLFALASNSRFQRYMHGDELLKARQEWVTRQERLVATLPADDQTRYRMLERRCHTILEEQARTSPAAAAQQGEGLARLLWIYLSLLVTRQSIGGVLRQPEGESLHRRLEGLQKQIDDPNLSEEVRRSLAGQVEIIQQRMEHHKEARQKSQFVDAEITRIQEQIELIREQSAMAPDADSVSSRIDHIAATLGGTTQWVREQQQIYGSVQDLLNEPPPIAAPAAQPVRESA